MNKRKLNASVKYLRALYADLEQAAIKEKDGIAKARYNEAARNAKATVGAMVFAWERANA